MFDFRKYPISVPYANPNYDKAMGGSHDMDYKLPPDTPVPAIYSGKIVDISSPEWGKQVGIKFDNSPNGVPYYAYLHLDAVEPSLRIGSHVSVGDVIGWSGGANSNSQMGGASNPTGTHFFNPSYQSSQTQVGIAMMYGPVYGSGAGWIQNPYAHPELNPEQLTGSGPITMSQQSSQTGIPGLPTISPTFWSQLMVGIAGVVFIIIGGSLLSASFGMKVLPDVIKIAAPELATASTVKDIFAKGPERKPEPVTPKALQAPPPPKEKKEAAASPKEGKK